MSASSGSKRKWTTLLVISFAATIGGSSWKLTKLRQQLEEAQSLLATTQAKISEVRLDLNKAVHQSELVHNEAEALRVANADASRDPEHEVEIKLWLGRVEQLKRLFTDRSDQQIPELELLTDRDWLLIGKTAEMDTEEHIRAALASARNEGKHIFGRQIVKALYKYTNVTHGELPPTTLALAPYFELSLNNALLERYEMILTGKVGRGQEGGKPAIREKSAIDPDYDNRTSIQANGGWTAGGPIDWLDNFAEKRTHAYQEYQKANHGAGPVDNSSLMPYFTPPLDPATREKILRLDQKKQK